MHIQFKQNLMIQMGQVNGGGSSVSPSSVGGITIGRKRIQMEQLSPEEIKMNRAMLQEISARKRERLVNNPY